MCEHQKFQCGYVWRGRNLFRSKVRYARNFESIFKLNFFKYLPTESALKVNKKSQMFYANRTFTD